MIKSTINPSRLGFYILVLVFSFSLETESVRAAQISEDFSDGELNLPSPYIGSKSSIVNDGAGGSNGSMKTIFDDNGHAPYVVSFQVPSNVQGQTLYYSYDMKTDNSEILSDWSSKNLKFRANGSNDCYWNTTVRWDAMLYGGGDCERDTISNIFASDTNDTDAPWRTGDINIVSNQPLDIIAQEIDYPPLPPSGLSILTSQN